MRPREVVVALSLLGVPPLALSPLALTACGGGREIEVRDIEGRVVRPLVSPSDRVVVLLFTATDCPISNRYAPEVGRLAGTFGPRGARFFLVYADPAETPEEIRRHVSDFGYGLPALRDPSHALVRLAGATVTPEAAVFAGSSLLYRGRIDDGYEDFGRARAAPTTHELAEALQAVLAGRRVVTPRTKAIGCFIRGPA